MTEEELQHYLDEMVILSAEIARKEKLTADDKTRLKAINQGEKLISQALNGIRMTEIENKIHDIELLIKSIDDILWEA